VIVGGGRERERGNSFVRPALALNTTLFITCDTGISNISNHNNPLFIITILNFSCSDHVEDSGLLGYDAVFKASNYRCFGGVCCLELEHLDSRFLENIVNYLLI